MESTCDSSKLEPNLESLFHTLQFFLSLSLSRKKMPKIPCFECQEIECEKFKANSKNFSRPTCCGCAGLQKLCGPCFRMAMDGCYYWDWNSDSYDEDYVAEDDDVDPDPIIVNWCCDLKNHGESTPTSSPFELDVLSYAACYGSLETMQFVIDSGVRFRPFAIHWLLRDIERLSRDVTGTVNERINLLMSTRKMLPDAHFYSETALDIIQSFPASVKNDLAERGIVIDVSALDTPVDEMISQLKV